MCDVSNGGAAGEPGKSREKQLLSVSRFADLANTTRRTLIFYDRQGLLHPARVTEKGYRLYSYSQLYELDFILGLPLDQIRSCLEPGSSQELVNRLRQLREKADDQIAHLTRVQQLIDQRLAASSTRSDAGAALSALEMYHPVAVRQPSMDFWTTDTESDCTPEQIARLYSDFYARLEPMIAVSGTASGFLTDLPCADSERYATSSFRFIKERSPADGEHTLPVITRPTGRYVVCHVANTLEGIQKGLRLLLDFAADNGFEMDSNLWQINLGTEVRQNGFSQTGLLEYRITAENK